MAATSVLNFSTSQTDFRASQSHQHQNATATFSYSDSPLTQLPTVDFNLDDLRRRMSEFTAKFDAYIERGRKRVLEERNDFRARLSELNGKYITLPPLPLSRTPINNALQRTKNPPKPKSPPSKAPSPPTPISSTAKPTKNLKCNLTFPISNRTPRRNAPSATNCTTQSRVLSARSTPDSRRNGNMRREWRNRVN